MALPAPLLEIIAAIITYTAPSQWCQAFFAIATITALSVQLIPKASQSLLLDYGPRATQAKHGAPGDRTDWLYTSVRLVTAVQVPHSWFNHFYAASVAASAFWAYHASYTSRPWPSRGQDGASKSLGPQINAMDAQDAVGSDKTKPAASPKQRSTPQPDENASVKVASKFSSSDGPSNPAPSPTRDSKPVLNPPRPADADDDAASGDRDSDAETIVLPGSLLHSEADTAVSSRFSTSQLVGIAIFTTGWLQQHKCHQYLASLKKYTLPEQGLFRHIVCAHYTCECLVYGGLAMAAAPSGRWFNRTLICGLWFVVVNLGSTAHGTKKWYSEKFGEARVAPKWKMIPFIF
ncbi:hypothetical protein BN1723_007565 [Verticillium longisporum]|uniref:Polyprenal reductase n=1 Tax=Verticillium longisporum TaxID=100787 RepID=A0A0G4NLX5_VERLO|nr:hypothetical protein BN1723_007565 [Verticillium longisporum]